VATWQNKEDPHCYGEGVAIGEEKYAGVRHGMVSPRPGSEGQEIVRFRLGSDGYL